jgi:hypothetical protein
MNERRYEVTESTAGFEEGDILDVTARFGDWHTYDLKLAKNPSSFRPETVVVTESDAGFSEAEILDPTARFGDWHECDLKFEPETSATDTDSSSSRIRLTMDELTSIAEPVEATG